MRTSGSSCRIGRVSWLVSVWVVTVLATLAIMSGPGNRPTQSGVSRPQTTSSLLAPLGSPANRPVMAANYGKLPLSFESNHGQTDSWVDFISRGLGYTIFLAGNEAVLSLTRPSAISRQRSANGKLKVSARTPNPGPRKFSA